MTREDIIRMAREAGIRDCTCNGEFGCLERSAALVAAASEAKVRAAMMQLFTDPENQPTQHGTVTVEYMQREVAAEREACAKVAGWLWQQFQDTKEAHERNSPEPFRPERFGFDQSTVQQSKRMMDAIRARGQA